MSWEISADEASQYLQLDMNQVLETAKNAFSNLILFATSDHVDNNLIASALGVDKQELQNHPEIAKTAVDNLYDNLTEVISKPSLETSEIVTKYNSELDDFKEVLKAEGIDISQEIEELTEQIQTTLSSEKIQKNLPVIIAGLNKFLKQMETSPEAAGKVIDELLKSLTEEIFIEEEKQLEEQRKEKYKKSAQEAIATSFKSLGLSSFSGGDL
jgi:BioD-like phosphotransacetylase family protein